MAPLMNTDDFGVEQSAKDTKHDLITTIGYTIPAADGGNIDMNDLSWEKPAYRDARQVRVHDVRGAEDHFSIDEHGFQYYKLPFIPGEREIDFANSDDPNIKDIHYKGMADWSAKQYVFQVDPRRLLADRKLEASAPKKLSFTITSSEAIFGIHNSTIRTIEDQR